MPTHHTLFRNSFPVRTLTQITQMISTVNPLCCQSLLGLFQLLCNTRSILLRIIYERLHGLRTLVGHNFPQTMRASKIRLRLLQPQIHNFQRNRNSPATTRIRTSVTLSSPSILSHKNHSKTPNETPTLYHYEPPINILSRLIPRQRFTKA